MEAQKVVKRRPNNLGGFRKNTGRNTKKCYLETSKLVQKKS